MRSPNAVNEMIEQVEGPAEAPNPQEKVRAFSEELTALLQKYGVEIVPYTEMYNNGQQQAAFKFVLVQAAK